MNNIEQYSFGNNFFYKIEDFQHIAPLARCHEDCVRVLGGRSKKEIYIILFEEGEMGAFRQNMYPFERISKIKFERELFENYILRFVDLTILQS